MCVRRARGVVANLLTFRPMSLGKVWNPLSPSYGVNKYILAKSVECLPMVRETEVHSQVESYQRFKKRHLMPPWLALSIIRLGSRLNWIYPGEGVTPSHTPWCSSYWKGSFWVPLNKGHQLYLYIYIYVVYSITFQTFLYRHLQLSYALEKSVF